ncbi:hypothetical protein [Pelomonas sp. BJYL3]|uniref:hypothetical protein n=1 Tax=Pelomonas sp. BJYL3 TaxID=2976697 RepID=UPI0022B467B5|nr:hypothetical protein [Pelomonas sp. BJYL3]
MALEFSLDSLAVVAVFVANAAVMVITIGTYWRMTRYEQSNHIHIVNALRETRDAGREMKIAAHELIRIAERGGVGGGGGLGSAELGQLDELMKLVRGLLDAYGGQDEEAEAGDEPEVRWPDTAHEMSSELMEQLRRSHRNEVDRLVAQRRRMQVELGLTRERLDDALKQLSASRHRGGGGGSAGGGPELQVLRQQLDGVRSQLQQAQDRQYLAETRAEKAERMATKLQKELEEMALAPKPAAQNNQAPEMMKLLEREALMLREQLAEAERTIQKLRAELAALAANPPEHADAQAVDEIRERLERELEQLRGKIDDLQDALKRNQVEKEFIEEHYLKEAQKNEEARLEAEATAAAMEFVGKTPGGR